MVSVIVPVYNAAEYLWQCLESISKQSYTDLEIICVNDGSSDNSEAICKGFLHRDARFRLLSQDNSGVSVARNNALEISTGDYVCFIDSDDVVASDFIQTLISLSKDGGLGICGFTRDVNELGFTKNRPHCYDSHDYIVRVLNETVVHTSICMMLFKNSIIQNNKIRFTPGCVRNEDTEFYIKYMTYENSIVVSEYKGYYYRDHPSSAVHRFDDRSLSYIEADQRISDYLVSKGIISDNNLIVAATVQYFVFKTARQKNNEIYKRVHDLYDVRHMMRMILKHPRRSRQGVALVYLLCGRKLFYGIISRL